MLNKTFYWGMLVLLLCSCTTVPVDIDYDESVAFYSLHNFAWAPDTPPKSNNPKIDTDTLLHDRLQGEIENWLLSHGYAKTQPNEAHFLVTYRVMLENRTDISTYSGYYGYPIGWGWGYYGRPYWGMSYSLPMQYNYDYQMATLIIDLLNPNTRKLIWRGAVSYEVDESPSPQEKREKIAWAVRQILQKYPPQKPPQ